MLTEDDEKLVRRVTSFYYGDNFERDMVSVSGVTTYIERIPITEARTMRAWVMQLDKYVDVFTPPYYMALAGINDDDGDSLSSARVQAAEIREESRRADEQRESDELDRFAAEGRRRRGASEPQDRREEAPERPREAQQRYHIGPFSRVDTGEKPIHIEERAISDEVTDGYFRPGDRTGRYGGRYNGRNSEGGRNSLGSDNPDAARRLTYETTYDHYGASEADAGASHSRKPEKPTSTFRHPTPRSTQSVINALGLDGVMLNAQLADGSFLRYVLERRIIFAAWRRGWINKRTRAYVADASVSQAAMAELKLAGVKTDALRTRDSASAARRIQKIEQASVIFESVDGLMSDVQEQGGRLSLDGKLLICDTMRAEQFKPLRAMGLSKVAVMTPMPEDTYLSTAELEAILSFVAAHEPRYLHITDWERLLDAANLRQEMFSLRGINI